MAEGSKKSGEKFENVYESWEHYLEAHFKKGGMYEKTKRFCEKEKEKLGKLKITKGQIRNLLYLRNVNAHSPSFLSIKKPAITLLQTLVNNFCKKAIDIATPKYKLYAATLDTPVKEVTQTMREKLYTQVPVIDSKKFIGTFSENTVLRLFTEEKDQENLLIKHIKNYLVPHKGTSSIEFLKTHASYFEVLNLFQTYIDQGKRLGVIYLTKNGKQSGEIEGLITAWDLHK